jgi:uncharacterized membrane protein YeaQ/YmgE (transglycosylase-associated protein family)
MALIIFLLVGGIAGLLAGKLMSGEGYGLVADIAIGVVGGLIGGLLFDELGITVGGLIGSVITAFAGAVILFTALRVVWRIFEPE